jgi:hypothetical protein
VLELLSFQELRGIEGQEIHRLFHISVKKSGLLSTVRMTTVTPIGSGVIYNQRFNASLLIRWSGGISYVRPFFPPQARKKRVPGGPGFGGMAASGSVSWGTPLAKMLYSLNVIQSLGENRNHGW